jgi:hypothetical protein
MTKVDELKRHMNRKMEALVFLRLQALSSLMPCAGVTCGRAGVTCGEMSGLYPSRMPSISHTMAAADFTFLSA